MRTLSLLTAAFSLAVSAAAAADPAGIWVTETGSSRVRVSPCGAGYCGTLIAAPGRALDANNPDAALRGRSVVGVQILTAREPDGQGFSGSLYNPNDGKTYSGSMRLTGADTLEVSGCVLSVLCKRQTWTRAR